MITKTHAFIILILLFTNVVFAEKPMIIPSDPVVSAKSHVLMDYNSGKILAANNETARLSPASLAKIMISYAVGQEIKAGNIFPEDEVLISENAWAKNFPDSSKMFIEVGERVTVADLNRGIIIQSGNDASVAIAEHIAGTEAGFVQLMNDWAKQLGLIDTLFQNSHGLDDKNQYTSAKDTAILSRALIMDVPEEYKIYKEKSFTFNNITQYNRNSLLWDPSLNVDGIKTGHTTTAGYNLASSAVKDNMRLIAVIMGATSKQAQIFESKKLLNWGFRFFENYTPHLAGGLVATERIWLGKEKQIKLGVNQDIIITVPRGSVSALDTSFELSQELNAPLEKGRQVGMIFYRLYGEVVATFPLVALNTVEKGNWFSRLIDKITRLFTNLKSSYE